jgi:hypothetical protein
MNYASFSFDNRYLFPLIGDFNFQGTPADKEKTALSRRYINNNDYRAVSVTYGFDDRNFIQPLQLKLCSTAFIHLLLPVFLPRNLQGH